MATIAKTTKEIRSAASYFCDFPRTNKFKRALDVALCQELPLEISIAGPFRGFKGAVNGKPARFKVKIKNTRTGEYTLFGRYYTRSSESTVVILEFRGCMYHAGDLDTCYKMARKNAVEHKMIWTEDELLSAPVTYRGPSFEEYNNSMPCWGDFARFVSKLCKEDFAHTEPCSKCGGLGFIQAFAHVDNGVCWGCMGSGWHLHLGEAAIKAGVE